VALEAKRWTLSSNVKRMTSGFSIESSTIYSGIGASVMGTIFIPVIMI
jgi:hypothetical protein